jgi:hypothetical protein
MSTYNVALLVEGLDLTDENLDRLFEVLPDAVPASAGGPVTVTSPVDAHSAESGVFALADVIAGAFPEAVVVRVDQDLVSIPDIAERTGRSRESIRLLVEGKRGPGGFPAPVGTVGDGIRVWPWASVLDWFSNALHQDLGEQGVLPDVAAVVDACLAARRRRFAHGARVAWRRRPHLDVTVKKTGQSTALPHPAS